MEKKESNKEFKSMVRGIRFKAATHVRLVLQAKKDGRSVNSLVERYCEKSLPKENNHDKMW